MTDNQSQQFMDEMYQQSVRDGQSQDANSVYSEYLKEERVRNIVEQINPDSLLEDIEHRIRGQIKDRFTKEWKFINEKEPPKVSEKMISNYISYLGSTLNQNTSLSNFSTKEINNLMENTVEYIRDDLSDNTVEYGFDKSKKVLALKEVKVLKKKIVNNQLVITEEIQVMEYEKVLEENVDYNEMNRIGNIICMATFAVLKRAQMGSEARRIFGMMKYSESGSQMPQKKGFADILKFWQ
jgi:uncharacterized membrane protein YheB (UPF0754 family)